MKNLFETKNIVQSKEFIELEKNKDTINFNNLSDSD
jgi:hypothetical protein